MKCPQCGFTNHPGAHFYNQCGQSLHGGQPQLPPLKNIEAHIEDEISGQIAVGNHNLQIGPVHDGVVNVTLPEQQPRPQPRPTPVLVRPCPFPDPLNREAEIDTATTALQSATPVEFYGQAGLGKTVLLRHLAHHSATASFPDGVFYLSARCPHTDHASGAEGMGNGQAGGGSGRRTGRRVPSPFQQWQARELSCPRT